jgi:hypothetical protein
MPAPDERPDPSAPDSPLNPSPGRASRATTHDDDAATQPPLKQHGDALLDGSGSRQGSPPDPERDAAPHE